MRKDRTADHGPVLLPSWERTRQYRMPSLLNARATWDAVVTRSSWTVEKALVVLTCTVYDVEPETSVQSNVRDVPGDHRAASAGDRSEGAVSCGAGAVEVGDTVSGAVLVTPPAVTAMVASVGAATALVMTVKVALVEPAGTSTLGGTVAALLLLATTTAAPPVGAGALKVTVPVDVSPPPVTAVGDRVRPATPTGPGLAGSTVNVADLVAPA